MRAKNNYERPEAEAIDLIPLLDICNNPSNGNTDSFSTTTSTSGWEDDFPED